MWRCLNFFITFRSFQKEQELKQLLEQEEIDREEARKGFRFGHIPVIQQIIGEARKKHGVEAGSGNYLSQRYCVQKSVKMFKSLIAFKDFPIYTV